MRDIPFSIVFFALYGKLKDEWATDANGKTNFGKVLLSGPWKKIKNKNKKEFNSVYCVCPSREMAMGFPLMLQFPFFFFFFKNKIYKL